ncbi:MAG: hypothetical protein PUP91_06675 [Rhizonema sp. PD37]|nr:hypothetical protein [Rhizonema sp. PD37]
MKNYNDLKINALFPRILVVVLVPERITDWLKQTAMRTVPEILCLLGILARNARYRQYN